MTTDTLMLIINFRFKNKLIYFSYYSDTISSVIISSQVITGNDNTTSGNTTIESILFDSPIELTFAIDLTNVRHS